MASFILTASALAGVGYYGFPDTIQEEPSGIVGPALHLKATITDNATTEDDLTAAETFATDARLVNELGLSSANPKAILVLFGVKRIRIPGIEAETPANVVGIEHGLFLRHKPVSKQGREKYYHVGAALDAFLNTPDASSAGTGDFQSKTGEPVMFPEPLVVDLEKDEFAQGIVTAVNAAANLDCYYTFVGVAMDKAEFWNDQGKRGCGGEGRALSAADRKAAVRMAAGMIRAIPA